MIILFYYIMYLNIYIYIYIYICIRVSFNKTIWLLAFDIWFEPMIIASLVLYIKVILKSIVHLGLFLLPQIIRIISRLLYYLGWPCAIYTGHVRTRIFILPKTSKVVWPITCMYCTSTNHGAREGEIYRERSKRCKYAHVLCRWVLCTI